MSRLRREAFSTEGELQRLIADNPHLLDGEQMRPGDARRWILVTREKGISETAGEAARWSVDHLLIDQDAVPTLVEVKRGSNPEIRRTIVGQMLEYAAHAQQTWTAAEIRLAFEQSAEARESNPAVELAKLLGSDEDEDVVEDAFWQRVETNLRASRLRLLFVADEIPDPLERVAGFLNSQMPGIEVLAVEIKQYRKGETQTLVPRVLGRLAKTESSGRSVRGTRQKVDRETFLAELAEERQREAVARLLDTAQGQGAILGWGAVGLSIRVKNSEYPRPISVAWLYPPDKPGLNGLRNISFGHGAISELVSPLDAAFEIRLREWADKFSGDKFATQTTVRGNIWTMDYDAAADNIDLLEERLRTILQQLQAL